jgi:poly-gamma-glutamate capsule biosynthesis protein CapA/YwtB (metallophosphatase superfamily)
LRAPLSCLDAEVAVGFSAMTLANNHMMDYGAEAMEQTRGLLRERGIATSGAGSSYADATAPAVVSANGTTVAMLGYTTVFPAVGYAATDDAPGVATVRVDTAYQTSHAVPYQPGTPPIIVTVPDGDDMARMEASIRGAHDVADLVVVQYHWGVSGHAYPVGYMKEMARRAVDAGADLVIGNHPHLLLGIEMYRGVPVCYNLNHFALDIHAPAWPGALDALVLRSEVRDGRFVRHSVQPCAIDDDSRDLSLCDPARLAGVQALLEGLSTEFGTTFDRDGDELVLGGPVPGTPEPRRAPEVLFDAPRFVAEGWRAAVGVAASHA